ncbi:plasminogen receptor (KT) [Latimeria chalumnae]|uniref:plasminogen receptor (KT) n=1 Tax=Latimeria chalumnae TaxID=7897 RepID=UPI00313B3DEB
MGFMFSKAMEEKRKQQEIALVNARLQLERQIQMQNQMRERQVATEIAWSREVIKYFGTFYGVSVLGLTVGAMKSRKLGILSPVIPLSFLLAYQYDMAYGTLLSRIKEEAEVIMEREKMRLEMPYGVPNFESIERARKAQSKFFLEKL